MTPSVANSASSVIQRFELLLLGNQHSISEPRNISTWSPFRITPATLVQQTLCPSFGNKDSKLNPLIAGAQNAIPELGLARLVTDAREGIPQFSLVQSRNS